MSLRKRKGPRMVDGSKRVGKREEMARGPGGTGPHQRWILFQEQ